MLAVVAVPIWQLLRQAMKKRRKQMTYQGVVS